MRSGSTKVQVYVTRVCSMRFFFCQYQYVRNVQVWWNTQSAVLIFSKLFSALRRTTDLNIGISSSIVHPIEIHALFCEKPCMPIQSRLLASRVGINPGFYHKAQPGGFYGFYEGGFFIPRRSRRDIVFASSVRPSVRPSIPSVRPSTLFVCPEPYLSTYWSDLIHSWYK